MGSLPKQYKSCLSSKIIKFGGEWKLESPYTGWIQKRHAREDLISALDYLLGRAIASKSTLAPWYRLLQ